MSENNQDQSNQEANTNVSETSSAFDQEAFKTSLLSEVNQINSRLASALTREFKKMMDSKPSAQDSSHQAPEESAKPNKPNTPSAEAQNPNLELQAAMTRIKELEKRDAERESKQQENDKVQAQIRRENAINNLVVGMKMANASTAKKVLKAELEDKLQEQKGQFYVVEKAYESGVEVEKTIPVSEFAKTFLDSEEGKLFKPGSGTKGAGTTPTPVTTAANGKADMNKLYKEAFKDVTYPRNK